MTNNWYLMTREATCKTIFTVLKVYGRSNIEWLWQLENTNLNMVMKCNVTKIRDKKFVRKINMESNLPSPIKAEQITRQIPMERFIFTSAQLTHSSGISRSTAAHLFTLRQNHWTNVLTVCSTVCTVCTHPAAGAATPHFSSTVFVMFEERRETLVTSTLTDSWLGGHAHWEESLFDNIQFHSFYLNVEV